MFALFDVSENHEVGRFVWSIEAHKDIAITQCNLNGKDCYSADEWTALAKSSMEQ
jgi:hypothetical protein